MNEDMYSNIEFNNLKERINKEILRRSTFSWWDPLATPTIGSDKRSPLTFPEKVNKTIEVNDDTYTINNPSEGSIERTRNIYFPEQNSNPGGVSNIANETSNKRFDNDEMKNYLIGLSKINDINLYYGADELPNTIFRDPSYIENAVIDAENSIRNKPLNESDNSPTKIDINGNEMTYPIDKNGYYMPSGEMDGEELLRNEGLNTKNFYDDYGAPEGVSDYKPYNPYYSPYVDRSLEKQGEYRDEFVLSREGGTPSIFYGKNPRNPRVGESYKPRPVSGGILGSCNTACTGLCYLTCDNQCSESCTTTCWGRCGNACTSTCGNSCTGCTNLCLNTCQSKCENSTGYSCVKAGAQSVEIIAQGSRYGEQTKNVIHVTNHTCISCSYSCQFYPNKKTECWDAACMGKCFTTCMNYCSTSCFGGCVDNVSENEGKYKIGIGRGCSSGCTINCIGQCSGVCEGYCTQTCWYACKASCSDNCEWICTTNCGYGCSDNCTNSCMNSSSDETNDCGGSCMQSCNTNCIGEACRAICGTGTTGACDANCRMNCTSTSCTSQCSNACSSTCSTCVNTCGIQCGNCTSECSAGCEAACNITCTNDCEHSCDLNCLSSCSESCGGCSTLCYSCVSMCIGVCSNKCESTCSNCANQCSWWCDSSCNKMCFGNCDNMCLYTCMGSCITGVTSKSINSELNINKLNVIPEELTHEGGNIEVDINVKLPTLVGPDKDPTAIGYITPHPSNREEEQLSFTLQDNLTGITPPGYDVDMKPYNLYFDSDENIKINGIDDDKYMIYQTTLTGGIFNINTDTNEITINEDMLLPIITEMKPNPNNNGSMFIVIIFKQEPNLDINDIGITLPFGFTNEIPSYDSIGNILIIIEKIKFL